MKWKGKYRVKFLKFNDHYCVTGIFEALEDNGLVKNGEKFITTMSRVW